MCRQTGAGPTATYPGARGHSSISRRSPDAEQGAAGPKAAAPPAEKLDTAAGVTGDVHAMNNHSPFKERRAVHVSVRAHPRRIIKIKKEPQWQNRKTSRSPLMDLKDTHVCTGSGRRERLGAVLMGGGGGRMGEAGLLPFFFPFGMF